MSELFDYEEFLRSENRFAKNISLRWSAGKNDELRTFGQTGVWGSVIWKGVEA